MWDDMRSDNYQPIDPSCKSYPRPRSLMWAQISTDHALADHRPLKHKIKCLVCLLSMDKNTETEIPTGRVNVPKVRTANTYCMTQRKCDVAEWVMRGNCGSYSVALSLLTLAVISLLTAPWVHWLWGSSPSLATHVLISDTWIKASRIYLRIYKFRNINLNHPGKHLLMKDRDLK